MPTPFDLDELETRDLVFLALLALLLFLALREVRQAFSTATGALTEDGKAITATVVRDFGLAAGIYVAARVATKIHPYAALAVAGGTLVFSVAGGWIRRVLEGDQDAPGGPQ